MSKTISYNTSYVETPVRKEEDSDLLFIAIPVYTYKKLSEAATKEDKTFAEALSEAIESYLHKEQ